MGHRQEREPQPRLVRDRGTDRSLPRKVQLQRSTDVEKQSQLQRLRDFQKRNGEAAPAALARLQEAAAGGENVFAVLMEAARVCSLGQVTDALFEVGGKYRRSM